MGITPNSNSGAKHVASHPYPDGGKSGEDKPGPNKASTFMEAKATKAGKPSSMTTRPAGYKK